MPPGRPRGFDPDSALDAAMELFWARGYRATTTREIEAALGIGQSSISHAFGSKAELMGQVLDRYQRLLDERLLDPLRTAKDGLEGLDRFFAALGDWLGADHARGCLIGRLMSEGDRPHEAVAEGLATYRARLDGALRAALERAAAEGRIPAETVDERVDVLTGGVLGLNLALTAGFGPDAPRGMARAIRGEIRRWAAGPDDRPITAPGARAVGPPAGPRTS